MRVTDARWRTAEDAKPAAERYARQGYDVAIVTHSSERAGDHIELVCQQRKEA